MNGSESSQGLTWWAKLSLWGAVFAAAALYLGTLDGVRLTGDWASGPAPDNHASGAAVPPAGIESPETPGMAGAPPTSPLGAGVSDAAPPVAVPAPIVAPPFSAPAKSTVQGVPRERATPFRATGATAGEPTGHATAPPSASAEVPQLVAPPAEASPTQTSTPEATTALSRNPTASPGAAEVSAQQQPEAQVTAEAGAPASENAADNEKAVSGQATGASRQVSHEEARAFAKAVLSEPKPAAEQPKAAPSEPGKVKDGAPMTAGKPPAPANRALAERQARILAEYEAMRRAAEAQRRRWPGAGLRPPMPPRGGYPFGPSYYYPPGR